MTIIKAKVNGKSRKGFVKDGDIVEVIGSWWGSYGLPYGVVVAPNKRIDLVYLPCLEKVEE